MSVEDGAANYLSRDEALAIAGECAARRPDFTGHHMLNYCVPTTRGPGLLRRLRHGYTGHDPRMLDEADALSLARAAGCQVPAVLYAGGGLLIEQRIDGATTTGASWPRWLRNLLRQVISLQSQPAPHVPGIAGVEDWQNWLRGRLVVSYERYADLYPRRLATLAIPHPNTWWRTPDPGRRRLVLLHGDLRPENLLLAHDGVWILDWELALVGDPVWEAATSLHRTHWPSDTAEHKAAQQWLATIAHVAQSDDLHQAVAFYREVELWRSLINDSERHPALIAANPTTTDIDALARSFRAKLARSSEQFGCASLSEHDARDLLTAWAAEARAL